jgi:ethanolamine utilization protein EutN
MTLGRVVGKVWATEIDPRFTGQRLLYVQPVTPELTDVGKPLVVTDSMGAGAGELVYWVRGKEASIPFAPVEVPTDSTIIAIVDEMHVKR